MIQYEVLETVKVTPEGKFEQMAIDFLPPASIKFLSDVRLKKGEMVSVDHNNVLLNGHKIGIVLHFKDSTTVSVSTDYDIKYTGGYSLDGETVYLDEHFPPILKISGKDIDIRKTIGLHHELPEKWMADEKYEYPYAHEVATSIEKKYVESLGITWEAYCHEVDKNLRQVYRRTLEKSPPSLDLAPYLYCRDQEALNEIRKSEPD